MWATLALAAMLQPVPAQTGKLALINVRPTYGILGQERKSTQVVPGDFYFVSFDIHNLQIKDNGPVEYSVAIEMTDKDGKSQFDTKPQDLQALAPLGGARLPAYAKADIGLDTKPGEYTFTVTVKDRASNMSAKFERKFEVVSKRLGIVGL